MRWINAYLMFDGNCNEAMEFYQKSLGGELEVSPFPDDPQRAMHAKLQSGGGLLMASDSPAGRPVMVGNSVWMAIECADAEEQERIFAAMSEGGTVTMPLADQFWGARFGMLTDKYQMNWMFNLDKPQA